MSDARATWEVVEPIHAVTYYGSDGRAAIAATGVRGFWMGYFGARAAPLGEAGPGVVGACFFGFPPSQVGQAVPYVWSVASPAALLAARRDGAVASLWAAGVRPSHELVAAIIEARAAIDRAGTAGRPLFAANSALPWPDEPLPALWHAATLVREHRGDAHVAVLVAAGIGAVESHILAAAREATTSDTQREARHWKSEAWVGATVALAERGWIDHGALTEAGARAWAAVEARTDDLSIALPDDVVDAFRPAAAAVLAADIIPFPNAMAFPRPAWA